MVQYFTKAKCPVSERLLVGRGNLAVEGGASGDMLASFGNCGWRKASQQFGQCSVASLQHHWYTHGTKTEPKSIPLLLWILGVIPMETWNQTAEACHAIWRMRRVLVCLMFMRSGMFWCCLVMKKASCRLWTYEAHFQARWSPDDGLLVMMLRMIQLLFAEELPVLLRSSAGTSRFWWLRKQRCWWALNSRAAPLWISTTLIVVSVGAPQHWAGLCNSRCADTLTGGGGGGCRRL